MGRNKCFLEWYRSHVRVEETSDPQTVRVCTVHTYLATCTSLLHPFHLHSTEISSSSSNTDIPSLHGTPHNNNQNAADQISKLALPTTHPYAYHNRSSSLWSRWCPGRYVISLISFPPTLITQRISIIPPLLPDSLLRTDLPMIYAKDLANNRDHSCRRAERNW